MEAGKDGGKTKPGFKGESFTGDGEKMPSESESVSPEETKEAPVTEAELQRRFNSVPCRGVCSRSTVYFL